MDYKYFYETPIEFSNIIMTSDGEFLTGLWFEGSKYISKYKDTYEEKNLLVFQEVQKWLDIYFSGKEPNFIPKYKINNLTPFRREVINIMNKISYGKTITYSDIASEIAKKIGINQMSSQAIGGAVGWNPICIIIPCHRVVGKSGSLTGYSGGMKNKISLLKLEKNDMSKFFVPKNYFVK